MFSDQSLTLNKSNKKLQISTTYTIAKLYIELNYNLITRLQTLSFNGVNVLGRVERDAVKNKSLPFVKLFDPLSRFVRRWRLLNFVSLEICKNRGMQSCLRISPPLASCLFQQHFTSSVFVCKCCFAQHLCTYSLGFVSFSQKEIGAKAARKMLENWIEVSISPTFYEQLLCTKDLLYLQSVLHFVGQNKLAKKLIIIFWWNWHQLFKFEPDFCRQLSRMACILTQSHLLLIYNL